jgi:hypothetical protein
VLGGKGEAGEVLLLVVEKREISLPHFVDLHLQVVAELAVHLALLDTNDSEKSHSVLCNLPYDFGKKMGENNGRRG